jgi:hypothetical protein
LWEKYLRQGETGPLFGGEEVVFRWRKWKRSQKGARKEEVVGAQRCTPVVDGLEVDVVANQLRDDQVAS